MLDYQSSDIWTGYFLISVILVVGFAIAGVLSYRKQKIATWITTIVTLIIWLTSLCGWMWHTFRSEENNNWEAVQEWAADEYDLELTKDQSIELIRFNELEDVNINGKEYTVTFQKIDGEYGLFVEVEVNILQGQ